MKAKRPVTLFISLTAVCLPLSLVAEDKPAQGSQEGSQAQALMMTGLKRDAVKTVTEGLSFYGLRRQSSQAKPPQKVKEQ